MNYNDTLIDDVILREGAFLLLSSSSINRYIRVAFYLGKISSIYKQIEEGKLSLMDIIGRARFIWSDLLRKPLRDVGEIELATILAIIARRPEQEVSELLNIIAMTDQLQVSWLSALARQLYRYNAGNLRISLEGSKINIFIGQRNIEGDMTSDNQEARYKQTMNLLLKSKASTHTEIRLAA